ncbi:ATP-binding protein [Azospira restricta]|uniref:histidine kinase n=1 Tax=Azospira restricta TaxID=404405 RepID=A0A974PXZ1_9RHOO|nr:ATP-binding protein [Azospira restricta]QRJ63522.1 sensor histidine kinase N-terminal domain-containing protein [Azospira restricta]
MAGLLHGRSPGSLRWRLLRWVSLATLLIWSLAAALSYRQARHEVQELMDGQMAKTARLLVAQARTDAGRLAALPANMNGLRGAKIRRSELVLEYRIVRSDGTTLLASANAPATPVGTALGYAEIEHDGQPWRSLVLETADGAYRVQVAHANKSRDKEALEIARKTVLPLALLLPLMIALIYLSVRRGLKPLDDLAADVAARSPENLAALAPTAAPLEAQPLAKALNRLLGRLSATLDNERRFTADAAHELRTPLAALKVQAQVAMATRDAAQHRHALAQVIAGADRATRLVEQLLRLARLDPLERVPDPQPVDLAGLARTAVDEARAGADEKGQTLTLAADAAAVSGDRDLLAVALRNLVDNAVRYTPEGGRIEVRVGCEHGAACVAVADNGPGVPAAELPRLVERFYRGREAGAEGSGLGLAIVRRIAELHGARLEVENAEAGGFVATLRWGPGAASAPASD